jgi:hypothetical protein
VLKTEIGFIYEGKPYKDISINLEESLPRPSSCFHAGDLLLLFYCNAF